MRRLVFATVSVAALLAAEPAHAQQAVFCTNCSTLTQELAGYARQLLQLQQEITTARQAVTNTLALPSTVYRDMTGQVQQIGSIAEQANMLNGNTRVMLNRLASATDIRPAAWRSGRTSSSPRTTPSRGQCALRPKSWSSSRHR